METKIKIPNKKVYTQVRKSPADKKVQDTVNEIFKFLRTTKFFTGL